MARYQSLTTLMLPNRSNLVLGRPLIMDMVVISSSSIQKPCTFVDVNSGNRTKEKAQEQNALDTNLGAADELARQLRLRDMGGIIVVDFIDMNLAEDRQMLYERMCKNMQKDRARHNILPLSKFGLMQITRQRVRPVMDVDVDEDCPTCFGTGKIRSSILFTDQLERKIDRLVNKSWN